MAGTDVTEVERDGSATENMSRDLALEQRIHEAAYALLAIRRLAIDAQNDTEGLRLVAIEQLAKSTFRGLDACLGRMSGRGLEIGNFATEFDFEESGEETANV